MYLAAFSRVVKDGQIQEGPTRVKGTPNIPARGRFQTSARVGYVGFHQGQTLDTETTSEENWGPGVRHHGTGYPCYTPAVSRRLLLLVLRSHPKPNYTPFDETIFCGVRPANMAGVGNPEAPHGRPRGTRQ